jgi:hypothetical protein
LKLLGHDQEGALPLLQRAHALNSADGETGYHFALALDATGKRAEAKMLLQSIIDGHQGFNDIDNVKQLLGRS